MGTQCLCCCEWFQSCDLAKSISIGAQNIALPRGLLYLGVPHLGCIWGRALFPIAKVHWRPRKELQVWCMSVGKDKMGCKPCHHVSCFLSWKLGFCSYWWRPGGGLIKAWLTPKGLRPFFCQKTLKLPFLLHSSKRTKKILFLESNHRILYFTCLRSCGKNFMKFDCTDWKILAFKVGK